VPGMRMRATIFCRQTINDFALVCLNRVPGA
jgi:hypothetical protein